MKRSFKSLIETYAPDLAASFRQVRESRRRSAARFVKSRYGFGLAGNEEMASGAFEPEEAEFVRQTLAGCDVFLDVGANIGFYTCLARSLDKHVVAFEPLTHNLDFLFNNILFNGWRDIEVFPVGLSSLPGLATLYGGSTGASVIPSWAGASTHWNRTIPLSTLDILIGERFAGRQILIKIDVEGHELSVLEGARSLLTQTPRPIWLIEVCFQENHPSGLNPSFQSVFEVFWSRGYAATTVEGQSIQPQDVKRWISTGNRDFGGVNYVFRPTPHSG